ncbi:MAG TPA: tetratricopeptide repeat protein [Bryobacteraceae bacterium]|nr:tetratricopeptide repeat protein [Bryobacteraceae bacterium]
MVTGTTRSAVLSVAAGLVLLFAFTTVLNSTYRAVRHGKAEKLYQHGVALAKAGHNAEAAGEFRAAIVFAHDDAQYRLALARSLMALGLWNEAESHLSELSEDDPTNGLVNLMLAQIAERDGRSTQAVTFYHRAIFGYWPEKPLENRIEARFQLVDLLARTGQQKQVIPELLELADEVPDADLELRERVGRLFLANGSPEHAAEQFKAIVSEHPHDAVPYQGLGDAEFALADFGAARSAYRTAARYKPEDVSLLHRILLSDDILELDPTVVRLTATERYARAKRLAERTLASFQACATVPADLNTKAQNLIKANPRRRRDGDTLALINVAQQLWKARQVACSTIPVRDEALPAVMTRISKQ